MNCQTCQNLGHIYPEASATRPLERKPCPQCQIDKNAAEVRAMMRNRATRIDEVV